MLRVFLPIACAWSVIRGGGFWSRDRLRDSELEERALLCFVDKLRLVECFGYEGS